MCYIYIVYTYLSIELRRIFSEYCILQSGLMTYYGDNLGFKTNLKIVPFFRIYTLLKESFCHINMFIYLHYYKKKRGLWNTEDLEEALLFLRFIHVIIFIEVAKKSVFKENNDMSSIACTCLQGLTVQSS